jgi:hypothetical protein
MNEAEFLFLRQAMQQCVADGRFAGGSAYAQRYVACAFNDMLQVGEEV